MGQDKSEYYIWVSEQKLGNDISEKDARDIYARAKKLGMKLINIEMDEYPNSLRVIDEPPMVLYCYGDISLLKSDGAPRVSVVGTRRTSPYGRWAAAEIGKAIAECGAVHISGMAEGIDSTGHRAVLDSGGKSVAVLGTGADVCFPKSSRDVYVRLKKDGLIVSEYKPGTVGYKAYFPRRNRIISALGEKCVVVEGALRSGSLITARIGLGQKKELYAVPGNINQPNSIGPNCLIEDGAIPIVNPTEIAETLGIGYMKERLAAEKLEGLEKELYEMVKTAGSIRTEDLVASLGAAPEKIIASLTILEIHGILRNEGGLIS